jgi:hypothetical protein
VGLSTGHTTLRAHTCICRLGLTAAGLPTGRGWKTAHITPTVAMKLRIFSHKVPFIIKTLSLPLRVTLQAGTVKRFAEASDPFIHTASALRLLQDGVLVVHPSGDKTVEVGGC